MGVVEGGRILVEVSEKSNVLLLLKFLNFAFVN